MTYNEQREWIFNCFKQEQSKQQLQYAKAENRKFFSKIARDYCFPDENTSNNKLYICKCMFMNTLGYASNNFITTSLTTASQKDQTKFVEDSL